MSGFFSLPSLVQTLMLCLYTLIVLTEVYCLIACFIYKTKKLNTALTVLLFMFSLINLFLLDEGHMCVSEDIKMPAVTEAICGLPVAVTVFLMIFQLFAVCVALRRIYIWRKTNITPMSIKQGADRLTAGFCCFDENGRPTLVNYSMERLCRSITGEPLMNANEFWHKLTAGDVIAGNTVIKSGDEPIILLSTGEVRQFSKSGFISGKKTIYEISAADITEQHQLSCRLIEYNSELEEVKKRLIRFSENVSDITREKEILAAKVSIHDRMGNALLAARRYIETGEDAVSRESLLNIWKNCIALLRREAEQPDENGTLSSLNEAAQIMGITLSVEGNLPENDSRIMRVILSAARECITNAVRHADASVLKIKILFDGNFYTVEYTNDGKQPEDEIREGGGLSSLRKNVEAEGGKMKIISAPQFMLKIKIPKTWGCSDG